MKNRNKMNNNGFSLVELIIVIAIMAVLIGVLAPQYLKYVERGRESADLDNIQEMVHAIEIYNADPQTTAQATGSIKGGASTSVTGTNMDKALENAGLPASSTMKSQEYQHGWEIEFTTEGWKVKTESKTSKLASGLGR